MNKLDITNNKKENKNELKIFKKKRRNGNGRFIK